jgi:hypothetical protein
LAKLRGSFVTLTDMMFHRGIGLLALVGFLLGALVFPPVGFGSSSCSMLTTMGIPCPSCGLTRSVTCVYHGEWAGAWQYNPFGFGFALLFVLLAPFFFMPERYRAAARMWARRNDLAITIVLVLFLGSMLLFGIVRAIRVQAGDESLLWWRADEPPPAMRGHGHGSFFFPAHDDSDPHHQ